MPRLKTPGKGAPKPISIKLDPDSDRFYRRKAQENGLSLSDYLRKLLLQGVVNENVSIIDQRLKGLISQLNGSSPTAQSSSAAAAAVALPVDVLRAIFFNREVLKAIVSDRNIQSFHDAQTRAEAETQRILGAAHG